MFRFARLRREDMRKVLEWRTQPTVSAAMVTDVVPDYDKQLAWFDRISCDPTCRYWTILHRGQPIGVINLAEISDSHRRCNAGYYVGDLRFKQLGGMVPPYLYNHVFRRLGLNKIFGEVLATNEGILRLHDAHGYRRVGVYKDHILKGGRFIDIVAIELLAESWLGMRQYERYVAEFE